ncbi:choice-of-anchor P family protein [Pimelobacter simplex]|uniref:choice-of-anchor P family protein n=1 Tax=Nocardioides simplex TaxID=2045 RepID=UPI003AB0CCA6
MNVRKLVTLVAFALGGAGLVAVPAPAHAADPVYWSYSASTGATYIKVLDGVVQSDLTAQSGVTGGAKSSSSKNSTAAVKVLNLAEVGAVETKTDAVVQKALVGQTTTLKSFARTAHVSLLGGLISADALETNVTTTGRADGSASYTANSRLANIKIAGIKLPLNIPKNYAVTIPGVASVTLNYALHGKYDQPEGDLAGTMAWAVGITLLKPLGGYSAGVTLLVNPVNQYLSEVAPASGASLGGTAYGTRIQAHVGDDIQVVSDPTARVGTPVGSSNGRTLTNSTLGVRVPGILTTGVISSTTTSKKDAYGNAEVTNTNQTAGINLLGGLVKANAIKVSAAGKLQDGKWTSTMDMQLVNLVIAGQKIPINVSPNTILNIAGLGKVALNLQQTSTNGAFQNAITAVKITLDTAQAGLPIGATVELGVAYTAIAPSAG